MTVGTCTVRTYSGTGRAHCLTRSQIEDGIISIGEVCSDGEYIGGSVSWSDGPEPSMFLAGVMLIRSTEEVLPQPA